MSLANTSKAFKISNVSFALGMEEDMIYNLSHDQMLGMIRGGLDYRYEGMEFTNQDIHSMICENPNLTVAIGVQPRGFKNGHFEISARAIWDRIDEVSYYKNTYVDGVKDYSSLNFKTTSNEANFGLAYIHQLKALRTFGIRFGAGTNMGYSFANRMNVSGQNVKISPNEQEASDIIPEPVMYEEFNDNYDIKNSIYNRVYAEAGADVTILNKVTFGLVYRHGYGIRNTMGSGTSSGIRTQSFRLFASYNL